LQTASPPVARERSDRCGPHEEWPVSRLVRVSGTSTAHFARSFRDTFGIPPYRYLLMRRVERAAARLNRQLQAILIPAHPHVRNMQVYYCITVFRRQIVRPAGKSTFPDGALSC